mmetsp:Transcript_15760/g.42327  ORF Transcript_15760/g.42327 Transcript_15760/m.42327 type:complete len:231 (+) Transcript_15760:1-693(+)
MPLEMRSLGAERRARVKTGGTRSGALRAPWRPWAPSAGRATSWSRSCAPSFWSSARGVTRQRPRGRARRPRPRPRRRRRREVSARAGAAAAPLPPWSAQWLPVARAPLRQLPRAPRNARGPVGQAAEALPSTCSQTRPCSTCPEPGRTPRPRSRVPRRATAATPRMTWKGTLRTGQGTCWQGGIRFWARTGAVSSPLWSDARTHALCQMQLRMAGRPRPSWPSRSSATTR